MITIVPEQRVRVDTGTISIEVAEEFQTWEFQRSLLWCVRKEEQLKACAGGQGAVLVAWLARMDQTTVMV